MEVCAPHFRPLPPPGIMLKHLTRRLPAIILTALAAFTLWVALGVTPANAATPGAVEFIGKNDPTVAAVTLLIEETTNHAGLLEYNSGEGTLVFKTQDYKQLPIPEQNKYMDAALSAVTLALARWGCCIR